MAKSGSNRDVYSCKVCHKDFSDKQSLKTHNRSHSGVRPFSCDLCPYKSTTSGNLRRHKNEVHLKDASNGKKFTCPICLKVFSRQHYLQDHLNLHAGVTLDCELCGKSFVQKRNLEDHMRIHLGEGFHCKTCEKKFETRGALKRHRTLKTCQSDNSSLKAKGFICDICLSSWPSKHDLKNHIRTHTGETPFKCDLCPLSFTRRYSLNKHKRIHTGDRPFVCDICGRRFAQKYGLSTHVRMHLGQTDHPCSLCNKSFVSGHQRNLHIKRVHADKKKTNNSKRSTESVSVSTKKRETNNSKKATSSVSVSSKSKVTGKGRVYENDSKMEKLSELNKESVIVNTNNSGEESMKKTEMVTCNDETFESTELQGSLQNNLTEICDGNEQLTVDNENSLDDDIDPARIDSDVVSDENDQVHVEVSVADDYKDPAWDNSDEVSDDSDQVHVEMDVAHDYKNPACIEINRVNDDNDPIFDEIPVNVVINHYDRTCVEIDNDPARDDIDVAHEENKAELTCDDNEVPYVKPIDLTTGNFDQSDHLSSKDGNLSGMSENCKLPDQAIGSEIPEKFSDDKECSMDITCRYDDSCVPSIGEDHDQEKEKYGEKSKIFTCGTCSETFSEENHLVKHSIGHKCGESDKVCINIVRCKECLETFPSKAIWKNHLCTTSIKSSLPVNSFSLQAGLNSSASEYRHTCSQCVRSFGSAKGLLVHQKTHNRVKLHPCLVCKKQFKFTSYLNIHMKTHAV